MEFGKNEFARRFKYCWYIFVPIHFCGGLFMIILVAVLFKMAAEIKL